MTKEEMCKQLEEKSREAISSVLENGIQANNVDVLYKLTKINKMTKESEDMYGNYGNYGNYGRNEYGRGYREYSDSSYGRDSYGRRGRDARYRGDDHLDRMYSEYGRYNESRGRYGAGSEESDKSFHYMLEAYKDFAKVLSEEAETPQQKQMLRETLQQTMQSVM